MSKKNEVKSHTVAKGDTISKIMRDYEIPASQKANFLALNNITDENLIRLGQELVLPGSTVPRAVPATAEEIAVDKTIRQARRAVPVEAAPRATIVDNYTVQSGDTVSGIVRRLGIEDKAAFLELNGIEDENLIKLGQTLELPKGSVILTSGTTDAAPKVADALEGRRGAGKVLYLTSDDGPNASTEKVLDTLRDHDAKAIFFFVGYMLIPGEDRADALKRKNIDAETHRLDPNAVRIVRRAIAEGHEIGSHTMYHERLTGLTPEQAQKSIKDCETMLERCAGQQLPIRFSRAPYGAINANIREALKDIDRPHLGWNVDSEDWKMDSPNPKTRIGPEQVKKNFHRYLGDEAIILFHDKPKTAKMLDEVLDSYKAKGYECELPPQASVDQSQSKNIDPMKATELTPEASNPEMYI